MWIPSRLLSWHVYQTHQTRLAVEKHVVNELKRHYAFYLSSGNLSGDYYNQGGWKRPFQTPCYNIQTMQHVNSTDSLQFTPTSAPGEIVPFFARLCRWPVRQNVLRVELKGISTSFGFYKLSSSWTFLLCCVSEFNIPAPIWRKTSKMKAVS